MSVGIMSVGIVSAIIETSEARLFVRASSCVPDGWEL